MGSRLRVNYQALEGTIVPQLNGCADQLDSIYSDMSTTVSSLEEYMSATTAVEYENEFTEIMGPYVQNLTQLIRQYTKQLSDVSAHFADVDAQIAKSIKSM